MLLRDRRGPLSAVFLIAAYAAGLFWSQLWLAESLGAPVQARMGGALITLLKVNAVLFGWRLIMRAAFTTSAYGWRQGLLSLPRVIVGNVIAIVAAGRALWLHLSGADKKWHKTQHIFPAELVR